MQALKVLVIFMGVLIAIGVTVIGITIYHRATQMVTSDKATPAESAPSTANQNATAVQPQIPPAAGGALAPQSFGIREVDLPPGTEIVSVQTVSIQQGQERVLLHARLPDGGVRILVLDPARGDIAGEWHVPGGAPRP